MILQDKNNIKKLLYIITFLIDISFLFVLNKYIFLKKIDKIFIYFILFCHFLFFISLYTDNKKLMYILHGLVWLSLFFSVFLKNKLLLIICLLLLLFIQFSWVFLDSCVLKTLKDDKRDTNSLNKYISTLALITTCILSYKIGKISHKNE